MHSEFEYHVAYQFSGLSTVAYKRVAYKKMSVGPQLEYQKHKIFLSERPPSLPIFLI